MTKQQKICFLLMTFIFASFVAYFLQVSSLDALSFQVKNSNLSLENDAASHNPQGQAEAYLNDAGFVRTEKISYLPLKVQLLARGN